MQEERYDSRLEKRILVGMIMNRLVLARLTANWRPECFSATWSEIVAQRCVDYFRKHKKAPKKNIQYEIEEWAEENAREEETKKMLYRFVSSLSDQYVQKPIINAEQLIDSAGKHFNMVLIRKTCERALQLAKNKKVDKALAALSEFRQVELAPDCMTSILTDEQAMADIFIEGSDPIVTYPEPLNTFFQGTLERDAFVAFLAPNKSRKSFWLMDVALRAALQRRRTAYYVIGDMSKIQVSRRCYARLAAHPFRNPAGVWPYAVKVPTRIILPSDKSGRTPATVKGKTVVFEKPFNLKTVRRVCRETIETVIKSYNPYLNVSCFAANSINIVEIASRLQTMEMNHNWIPEVIVIDYADNLAPITRKYDKRDQINETWQEMRGVALRQHCLLVTATQADAGSFNKTGFLDRSNFSDDRRKLDAVTGIVGINITETERAVGLSRLKWINIREGDDSRVVHVASCLPLSNPMVLSASSWYHPKEE